MTVKRKRVRAEYNNPRQRPIIPQVLQLKTPEAVILRRGKGQRIIVFRSVVTAKQENRS